jgi:ferritin-like metal-binding protein YciE
LLAKALQKEKNTDAWITKLAKAAINCEVQQEAAE